MLKQIKVKICGCAFIHDPCVATDTIFETIYNTLCDIVDVNILYEEESIVIQMLDCPANDLGALQFLKEVLCADYIILY